MVEAGRWRARMLPSLARLALSKGAAPTGWLTARDEALGIPDIVQTILKHLAENDEEKACENAFSLCQTQGWIDHCKTREVWILLIEHVFGLKDVQAEEDPKQVFKMLCGKHKARRLAHERLVNAIGQRRFRILDVPLDNLTLEMMEAAAWECARDQAMRMHAMDSVSVLLAALDTRMEEMTVRARYSIRRILPPMEFESTYNRLRRRNAEDAGDSFGEFVERIVYKALSDEARFRKEFEAANRVGDLAQLETVVSQRWWLLEYVPEDNRTLEMLEAAARGRAREEAISLPRKEELDEILALHENRQWAAVNIDPIARRYVNRMIYLIELLPDTVNPSFRAAYNRLRRRNAEDAGDYFVEFAERIAYGALLAEARIRREFADALDRFQRASVQTRG